jgi:hypothetical protein
VNENGALDEQLRSRKKRANTREEIELLKLNCCLKVKSFSTSRAEIENLSSRPSSLRRFVADNEP